MTATGPRPVVPIAGTAGSSAERAAVGRLSAWRALVDLAQAEATGGLRLPWRVGQQVTARIIATTAATATLQFGQTVLTAQTGLSLPVGGQAEFVVRRLQGQRVELQLVRLDASPAAAERAGEAATAVQSAATAWQVAFVLPDGLGQASVARLPRREGDAPEAGTDAAAAEQVVIRWESAHLGTVEMELDVSPGQGGAPPALRLAARAGKKQTAVALRATLGSLSERLQALGFAVRSRSVGPLRRRQAQHRMGLRLDAKL